MTRPLKRYRYLLTRVLRPARKGEPRMGDIPLTLHSKERPIVEVGVCNCETLSSTEGVFPHSTGAQGRVSTTQPTVTPALKPLHGEHLTRRTVLTMFCDPLPRQYARFLPQSEREWRKLLHWLDLSGLALYFLDRLSELDLCGLLPAAVLDRLQLNLIDNTQRTQSMVSESVAIQQEFQKAGIVYANLKGLSLCPQSVPKLELRLQFDLDFLIAARCLAEARTILERRGYRLYANSGRSWEFKFNERPGVSLRDIYKDFGSYAVELHVELSVPGAHSLFERLQWREFHSLNMPLLSPADLLLGQGLHAFKHICGETPRAAHLLEFRRHVLSRRDDIAFWRDLHRVAQDKPRAHLGLGIVILMITRVMGDFAPEVLTSWTVDGLSWPVRLWVELYGHRVALGSYPGSKLYLLLQQELQLAGVPEKRSLRRALLPSRLPPPAIRAFPNEAIPVRIRRYSMHFKLILERLRFHIVEGIRFAVESRRWRRMKEGAL